ncbi:hypothetical protein QAD02_011393, partial [Eretmocerus hayati]
MAVVSLASETTTVTTTNENLPSETIKVKYPEVRHDESIYDEYHGVNISDPYRWLENPDSEETKAFIKEQNAVTQSFITAYPKRQAINDRLKQVWNFPKYTCPRRVGNKYYFHKNTGLQNQSVVYVQDSSEGEAKIFFDPNTLSEDGTTAITQERFSPDGNFYAYALSKFGSDWKTINLIDTRTGKKLPEVLKKVKFSSIQWTLDSVGFFYSWYPQKKDKIIGPQTDGDRNEKLCYHRVGTSQSEDVVVAEFPSHPYWRMNTAMTESGEYLFIFLQEKWNSNLFVFTKLNPKENITGKFPFTQVIKSFGAQYDFVTYDEGKAIFKTNKNASNFKLVGIDLENFEEDKWVDLVPEHPRNVMEWAVAVDNDKLVICYSEDAKNTLDVHSLKSGKHLRQLPIELGRVDDFSGDKGHSEIFYQVKSFLIPGTMYRVNLTETGQPKVYREVEMKHFDTSLYKTTQIFYRSKDGAKIPMFIVARKDVVLNGSSPALLEGYGGFNYFNKPSISASWLVFLQHFRGIVALPNIRGGGEYGQKWHDAGRLFNKQNSFDDFQSAAEYLIRSGYTTSKKLTIQGISNGGLMVGACINQRPDLFGAAIAEVGIYDMLKFHKFTIGYTFTSEYGSSDNPDEFKNLLKYSPLHNIKPLQNGAQYPATLLLTAEHDNRVVPMHSLKHIATLQHEIGNLSQQTNPLLIRVEARAGHYDGKSTSMK